MTTQRLLDRPDPVTLADLKPAWHSDAACDAQGTDRWFPDSQGAHARAAKKVCAACPVLGVCLDAGLWDADGIWGGAGEGEKRVFRRAVKDRVHGPGEDCGVCRWCVELSRHRQNLAAIAAGGRRVGAPAKRYGAEATHGRRVTHARGCRGTDCGGTCQLVTAVGDRWAKLIPTRPSKRLRAEEAA